MMMVVMFMDDEFFYRCCLNYRRIVDIPITAFSELLHTSITLVQLINFSDPIYRWRVF